ncbi:hypothetical protein ABZ883_02500 [Streptomyces sp. NPDC046977]|uniref:hypothetical protein n=1 Tax=Streptomyces sp. NPDC046977 TaxID=3154703 RepID=UPI0033F5B1E4
MATNTGKGFRLGSVKRRTQTFNSRTGIWTKRGTGGRFMSGKADGSPFKGIRREA